MTAVAGPGVLREIGRYRASEKSLLFFDRHYTFKQTRRGVLALSGAGSNADTQNATAFRAVPVALARAGYPVFTADFGADPNNLFGNDTHIAAVQNGFTFLTASRGAKADKIYGQGGSMGALGLLNWARQHPTAIGALALLIPALDPNNIYVNNLSGYQATIGTAYGVTYPTALPNQSTHAPVSYPGDVIGFPIKIWSSDNDPLASNTTACQTWAAAVNAAGGNVTVASLGSVGHAATSVDPDDIIRFLDANGGRS